MNWFHTGFSDFYDVNLNTKGKKSAALEICLHTTFISLGEVMYTAKSQGLTICITKYEKIQFASKLLIFHLFFLSKNEYHTA